MTPEGKLVARVKKEIKTRGGEVRKIEWTAHHGAPDLLIMIHGKHYFVEMKAGGCKPEKHQLREHEIMRKIGGCDVRVVTGINEVMEFIDVCSA